MSATNVGHILQANMKGKIVAIGNEFVADSFVGAVYDRLNTMMGLPVEVHLNC